MYGASCCKVGLVEVADESEGSYEVGGEVFGIIEEIGDGVLSVWILRWISCHHIHG